MTQCWQVEEYGDFESVLNLVDRSANEANDEGNLLIRVLACGINFSDLLAIAGKYQVRYPLPFIPGSEVVGEILKTSDSARFRVGERILGYAGQGGYAATCTLPADRAFPLPEDLPASHAATLLITYQTAWIGLHIRAAIQPGELVLIHNGSGGVGTAAIQIAKQAGATVIATAGSAEKLDICSSCGADYPVNYKTDDFREIVKQVSAGNGADIIFDSVGGDTFDLSTKCIAWNGRLVVVGFAGGRIPEIAANRIMLKNIAVTGVHWPGYFDHQRSLLDEVHRCIIEGYQAGTLMPVIDSIVPMSDAKSALLKLKNRSSFGKLVLQGF